MSHQQWIDDFGIQPSVTHQQSALARVELIRCGWPTGQNVGLLTKKMAEQDWMWEAAAFAEGLWVAVLGPEAVVPADEEYPASSSRPILAVAFTSNFQIPLALRVAVAEALKNQAEVAA